jgi:hypothetical protein
MEPVHLPPLIQPVEQLFPSQLDREALQIDTAGIDFWPRRLKGERREPADLGAALAEFEEEAVLDGLAEQGEGVGLTGQEEGQAGEGLEEGQGPVPGVGAALFS